MGTNNGNSSREEGDAVTYEDLISFEYECEETEMEIVRLQNERFAPLWAKRASMISRIPNFWALAFEQCPADLDQYIQPDDSKLFAEALVSLNVRRFEPDVSPRSVEITMTFKKDNEWLEDEVLTKKFYYRRGGLDCRGLVSEPVQVRWKKGKDLTNGLTDMAHKLFAVRQAKGLIGAGDWSATALSSLKEHKDLAKKLAGNDPSQFSFFTLFGFVSEKRWVSAEESARLDEEFSDARAQKLPQTEDVDEATYRRDELDADVEICPHGDDVATYIAEDLFPNAIKYFVAAQEQDDDEEDIDMEDDGMSESDEDEEIDIRSLVGKGKAKRPKEEKSSVSPPPKIQRT